MNTIPAIIKKKRAMLALAQQAAAKLVKEIAMLESLQSPTDELEQWLETKVEESQARPADSIQVQFPLTSIKAQAATPAGRNPKGATEIAIKETLGDGAVKDITSILDGANKRLPNPLTRNAIRTQLMYLKQEGKVLSPTDGSYSLP